MPVQNIKRRRRKTGGAETKAQNRARWIREAQRLSTIIDSNTDALDNLPAHLEGSRIQHDLIEATLSLQREVLRIERIISSLS